MKIYGEGFFKYPGHNREVWDFEDGPFETMNPVLIDEARRLGFGIGEPMAHPQAKAPKVEEVKTETVPTEAVKKAGRPRSKK